VVSPYLLAVEAETVSECGVTLFAGS